MTSAGFLKKLRSPLRSRDVCVQRLRQNVLFSEKSKEAPRRRSLSIGWLFLRSMPPTLLPKRQPKETREDATLSVWWWRSFIGPSVRLNSSLLAAATVGLRFVHTNRLESASWCILGGWRRVVTSGTCCGISSAPKEMPSRSTWRLALFWETS